MRSTLIKSILYFCAVLPLPVLHLLGNLLGLGLWLFPGRMVEIASKNIALCLPELTRAQQGRLLRKCLRETGKTILETGALWLRPASSVLRLIRAIDGLECVENSIAAGRGAILSTPHLGAWEAAGLYCAARFDITCLYRPLRIQALETLVNHARSRAGGNFVPANARGIRALFKTLEEGGTVAMLPDQEPQAGTGVFVPFFGTPAYTMVFLSRLTARSGAPIVFVWCERLSWGRGYVLHFRRPPPEAHAADLETSATAINRAVENCIRECPSQYQWSYKRFRTRPNGEASLYR
jgi:Kdo2-lipid IVA lauroyltransferase/acyltransferase